MSDQDDALSGEVSVEVKVDEAGVKAAAKSRAIVALDRLCGNAIDIVGARVEGAARRTRLKNALREALIQTEGKAAIEALRADPRAGQRSLEVFLEEQGRKQSNRDAVAIETLDQLKALPPPPEDDESDPAPIDEDWLNVFSQHAENASSDHLRKLWARILAGEIRRPRSFSLTTLRAISELDLDIARTFQDAVKVRLDNGFLPKPKNLSGDTLLSLSFLEEVGLLQDVSGSTGWSLVPDESGYVLVSNGNLALRVQPLENKKLRLPIILITRVGREIASILPIENEDASLRAVAEILEKNAESMELCSILQKPPIGQLEYQIIERIK